MTVEEKLKKVFGDVAGRKIYNRFSNKKKNAAQRGLDFTLEAEDYILMGPKLLGYGTCDYTGAKLELSNGGSPVGQFHPTVERVDCSRGYVRGNVCVVSERANILKDTILDKELPRVRLVAQDVSLLREMIRRFECGEIEKICQLYNPDVATEWPDASFSWCPQYVDTPSMHPSAEHAVSIEDAILNDDNDEEIEMVNTPVESEVKAKENTNPSVVVDLPEDVQIALLYANVCKSAGKSGMAVSITFGQFKNLWRSKRCFITGKKMEDHYPVILDPAAPLDLHNLKFSNAKEGAAFAEFMCKIGVTAFDLAKNLKVE